MPTHPGKGDPPIFGLLQRLVSSMLQRESQPPTYQLPAMKAQHPQLPPWLAEVVNSPFVQDTLFSLVRNMNPRVRYENPEMLGGQGEVWDDKPGSIAIRGKIPEGYITQLLAHEVGHLFDINASKQNDPTKTATIRSVYSDFWRRSGEGRENNIPHEHFADAFASAIDVLDWADSWHEVKRVDARVPGTLMATMLILEEPIYKNHHLNRMTMEEKPKRLRKASEVPRRK